MNTAPLVSLILVTFNSAALLPDFFEALATTDYSPYETIVVDNASVDLTLQYLAAKQPQVRAIASADNLGFGRACNMGAHVARGEILVFLNPDVIVSPTWLSLVVRHLHEQRDAAILCPTTLYPEQSPVPRPEAVADVATVPGCAMVVRQAAWVELGGFDEQIWMYWEDTELCWRAWLLGWRVLEDRQAYVYHPRGEDGGRWDAERTRNSLYTYLKLMRWRRVVPFVGKLALTTMVKFVLKPRRALLEAWIWNATHLRRTLVLRRQLAQHRSAAPLYLEQMIDVHTQQQAIYRRTRRRSRAATST